MKSVGIIVNPASGKDIRRVIASGTVVTNQEKINIVVRMLKAMDGLGVDSVYIMPDPTHIGGRVINELNSELHHTSIHMMELPYLLGTWKDTHRTAAKMCEEEFACIIVMGGDGTSRIVAKACGSVPILPISTGTNNVFPQMVEGTLVGMAAAMIATGKVTSEEGCYQAPVLELRGTNRELIDTALIDLVVTDSRDLGSRAVWEEDSIRELFLTTAEPTNIGLSSIGGWLHPLEKHGGKALRINVCAEGKIEVTAPIAPGLLKNFKIESYAVFEAGEDIAIEQKNGVIALDGEREVLLNKEQDLTVNLCNEGPVVVDLNKTLSAAGGHCH
jgi:predicted polyphosphate/ATP-dependent NAD kinase